MPATRFRIGDAHVQKVFEMDLLGMTFPQLLPALDQDAVTRHSAPPPPGYMTARVVSR